MSVNIANRSKDMPWYKGLTVFGTAGQFQNKKSVADLPFRFPVQDIYKFTAGGMKGALRQGQLTVVRSYRAKR